LSDEGRNKVVVVCYMFWMVAIVNRNCLWWKKWTDRTFCASWNYQWTIGCNNQTSQKACQVPWNSIKIIILLDIFLWCQFNVMLIMECCAKWLICMLKNSK
jgi:hypothetical protein